MVNKPELLSPAGDLEKLETAVRFGADAVYLGAGAYSLRTQQTSFSLKQLRQGIQFAHRHKVKIYLALNIFAYDSDLPKMLKYLKSASKLGIDAVIISDIGLLSLIQKLDKKIKIHLSTQANTLNSQAVKFWQQQGVKRVVLGREVNLAQAREIKKQVPGMELELFVHGAMCVAYSGRCLLSKYLTGRSANRGECTHPCRWGYILKEPTRPQEEFSVQQDSRGTYILNSKDLCMIEHISRLKKAGIDSFKIEGRMKSSYYVALTAKVYRLAIDSRKYNPAWKKELEKVSHRQYTTGFYLNDSEKENSRDGACIRDYAFVGVVKSHNLSENELEVKARNYFGVGDDLEVIDPHNPQILKFRIESLRTTQNKNVSAAHNNYQVFVSARFPAEISPDSLLRRKV